MTEIELSLKDALATVGEIITDYKTEARQLLAQALKDRAPATVEALEDESIPLGKVEDACVLTLAFLLMQIDDG